MFLHLSVSHSVHMGGAVSTSVHAGIDIPRQTPPPAADGTHPTGMHSCLVENFTFFGNKEFKSKRLVLEIAGYVGNNRLCS